MKITITDSGLGGLSVCARLDQQREAQPASTNIELSYVNAAPEDDRGYNQMDSRSEKIQTFDQVLHGIQRWLNPDCILVACNTLSALMHETPFVQHNTLPVFGIVDIGVSLIEQALKEHPKAGVFICATDTTVDEQIYSTRLKASGIAPERLVEQAFTGVATMISNDSSGNSVYPHLCRFAQQAKAQTSIDFEQAFVFLGCTHYGYRAEQFAQAFAELGASPVFLLNPNEHCNPFLSSEPFHASEPTLPLEKIRFLSRYRLPDNEVSNVAQILEVTSSRTANALRNYEHQPQLF